MANPLSAHSFILDPDVVEYMLGMTGSTTRYDRSDVEEDFDQFDATTIYRDSIADEKQDISWLDQYAETE